MRPLHLAFLALLLPGYAGGCLFGFKSADSRLVVGFDGTTGWLHFRVSSGPLHPVATEGVENSAPLEGATLEVIDDDDRVVASGVTDLQGDLVLAAPPGAYTVRALAFNGERFPVPPDTQRASVIAGSTTDVHLEYDTGIR